MDNARRTAVLALVKQENNGYSNIILSNILNNFEGTVKDRAFVSALFYGTLERRITLDFILSPMLKKPIDKLDAEVRAILRCGLYQAKFMTSVPLSAAVNESVALARALGKTSASGLVNAVLRKAAAINIDEMQFANELDRLACLYAVTPQIAKVFIKEFGIDAENELKATFNKTPLCIRVNTLATTIENMEELYAKQNIKTERGSIDACLYVDYKGDITATKAFRNGLFHIQGEASQLACAALSPKSKCKVIDLCSAPGGKAATLAQYMGNEGELICCDSALNRLSLIDTLLLRNKITCAKVMQNNAEKFNNELCDADYVLCDVPCSGLGVISQKPDIRFKTLDKLNELIDLQQKILRTAAQYVKKGGKLVYSTCTINSDENANIINKFIEDNKDFVLCDIKNIHKKAKIQNKMMIFTPYSSELDGFFVASLERL
ncbi:MAG: 16S rRNA (cytosine(967)-C(5))-methyltransferase RsmB [Oscillospiraceae bacterium]